MTRIASVLAFTVVLVGPLVAQFPLTRTLEVRLGQRRPAVTSVAQDHLGLLWVGTDMGVVRSDGERMDLMLRTEQVQVTALVRMERAIMVAISDGAVLRCDGVRCDTLSPGTEWSGAPVRSLEAGADGSLWIGTYGKGLWHWRSGVTKLVPGLPDDHINDITVVGPDRVVVATDQGLALCTPQGIEGAYGEVEGAPDNLVLCVASDGHGGVWAGSERGGVFHWQPDGGRSVANAITWSHGPVTRIAVDGALIWAGTTRQGLVLFDTGVRRGSYVYGQSDGPTVPAVQDLMVDRDGVVWWCNGRETILRSDPTILVVPEHEGVDLKRVTALCSDSQDRIWLATPNGLFQHAAAFAEEERIQRIPMAIDARTPIVSMAASANGTVWAATFGNGVFALRPEGGVTHYTSSNGLVNDNVLSIRTMDDVVWMGTLDGVVRFQNGVFDRPAPEPGGFIYDVLPSPEGEAWAASDGAGILHIGGRSAKGSAGEGHRTFYGLVQDERGGVWAAGPGTGLCAATGRSVPCQGADLPPFTGDLYGAGRLADRIIVCGSGGTMAFDPVTFLWTDVTARFGLEGIVSELNTLCNDAQGDLWIACSKGLVRLQTAPRHIEDQLSTIITGLRIGSEAHLVDGAITTSYDRNDITVLFTALHYADPGALRFEYRMVGLDPRPLTTRDREASFAALAPGRYIFEVRTRIGEMDDAPGPWTSLAIEVTPPWWQRTGVRVAVVLLVLLLVLVVIRLRDRRLHERDRMERERVRFQLEALRSQVDPHFLFNSFNTLVELIESDPEQAVAHVERLSAFFRSILLVRDKELITLREELELLDNYLELERIRFGDAVRAEVRIEDEATERCIVPLTLQMLVENAIKHNVATPDRPLYIEIVTRNGNMQVGNTINPKRSAPRSTGFGLESIRKRYEALTARPMVIERVDGRFIVQVPLLPGRP